jgi:hypothetical protein
MVNYTITCRTMSAYTNSCGYKHVSRVGVYAGSSYLGTMTREEMVAKLKAGQTAETKGQNGSTAKVYIKSCKCGTEYLTTVPDNTKVDNLDNLPNC